MKIKPDKNPSLRKRQAFLTITAILLTIITLLVIFL